MVELKGSLAGIGLPAIIQLIGELRHSGTLELAQGESTARLAFDDGRLIAAECGEYQGVQAVAACATNLTDAEFTFIEGSPTLNRTLDLAASDLKQLVVRATNGETVEPDVRAYTNGSAQEIEQPCPLLGFADDRDRHYSRPTALHRCYASGAPSLVTAQEQRELCLGGRFGVCPRYRNAQNSTPVATAVKDVPRISPRADAPRPAAPPVVAPPVVAAASQTHITPDSPTIEAAAPRIAESVRAEPVSPAPEPVADTSSRRTLIFVAGGAAAALVLVGLVLIVAIPELTRQPTTAPGFVAVATPTKPSATVLAQATSEVTAPQTNVVAAGAQATAAPTFAPTRLPPTPTAVPRPATPTSAPRSFAASDANSLVDVRFASGPAIRWIDNVPFAGWSNGAYRLQAKKAASFVAVGVPLDRVLGDVIVSGVFRKTGGPPGGGYGLIVRDQGPEPRDGVNQDANAYVLETGDLGEFGIWRRDGDHWVDLVPWTRSPVVRPGGSPNELLVRAIGDHLTFLVNGVQLADVQDDTLLGGGVGIFAGGDYNEVALDHFSVQLPD